MIQACLYRDLKEWLTAEAGLSLLLLNGWFECTVEFALAPEKLTYTHSPH